MTLDQIIAAFTSNIINPLIYLVLALAIVIFLWGLISYFQNIDNSEERAQGIRHMIWGVVGLVIILSFQGIINVITNFLKV